MNEMRFELKPVAKRSEMRFELRRVAEKRKRRFERRRKYDPILDRFIESGHDLVEVEVENRDAGYIRSRLVKLIKERGLEGRLKASVVNGVLYLEKVVRGAPIS